MTQAETKIRKEVQLAASLRGWRLFRNNVGVVWKDDRCIVYGLCPGSSDLIGWTDKGRFVAIEIKTARGRASNAQVGFINTVRAAGGIGAIIRSVEEFHRI